MDKEQIEKALEILKHGHELSNISKELEFRILKKHHEIFSDLIIDIEKIADLIIYLEEQIYYEYLNQ